jgi:hypothetical protein
MMEDAPLLRTDVLDRFRRLCAISEPIAFRYRRIATINERFVEGDQWGVGAFQGASSYARDVWFDDEGIPRIYVNECQGLMTTWSALLNRDRRSATAEPASEDLEDIYRAEIANRVIEFFIAEQNTAAKIHQAVQYAFQDGTAGIKVLFDRRRKAIVWSPLTIHTYLIDPVPDYREAQWVIFTNHYTEDEVAELWEANHIQKPMPEEQVFRNAAGEECYGIEGHEVWHRPTRKFPRGFYACIIQNEVVELMEYPLVRPTDGEPEYLLPLALMKVRNVRDSAYGKTPMTDVVPLQRSMNEAVSRIQAMIRAVTKIYLKLPKTLQVELDAKPNTAILGFDESPKGVNAAKAIGFTQAGEIPQQVFEQRDYFRSMMNEVAGLNDVTVGNEQRSLSGKALDTIYALDAQKNADAAKSLEDMVIDCFHLTLAQFQLFYPHIRQGLIGNASAAEIADFDGIDVQGVDLRLQQSSELDALATVREGAAAEGLLAGTKTPGDLERARRSPMFGLQKRMAQQLVDAFLAGEDIDVEPEDLDLALFDEVIGKAASLAMRSGRKDDWKALYQLRRWVKEELGAAAMDATPQEAEQQVPA